MMCVYTERVAFSSLPPRSVTAVTSLLEHISFLSLFHLSSVVQTKFSTISFNSRHLPLLP